MATVEELEKTIEQLREQVISLQDGFEKFQRLLTGVIETKRLKVDEDAQIGDRDIGQTLNDFEQRLNNYDGILSNHDANITAAKATANDAVNRASNAQTAADNAQATANDAVNRASNAQSLAQSVDARTKQISSSGEETRIRLGSSQYAAFQTDGNLVVYADPRNALWASGTNR